VKPIKESNQFERSKAHALLNKTSCEDRLLSWQEGNPQGRSEAVIEPAFTGG
jgi:hypothetical protein